MKRRHIEALGRAAAVNQDNGARLAYDVLWSLASMEYLEPNDWEVVLDSFHAFAREGLLLKLSPGGRDRAYRAAAQLRLCVADAETLDEMVSDGDA